ncbi:MAG: hypothetical protein IIB82_17630 [Bacteroidetes bacterium]|nr:hypothetical protein [Bacteroidota bacterium]
MINRDPSAKAVSVGKETATMVLEAWQGQQKSADEAKIATTVLTPGNELAPSEFSEVAEKVRADNPNRSEAEVMKKAMKEYAGILYFKLFA